MNIDEQVLKTILLEGGYVKEGDIKKANSYLQTHVGSFSDYLLEEGLMSRDLIGQAMAESFKVPFADLNSASIPSEQILLIPEDVAKKYRAIVFSQEKNDIVIATDTPLQSDVSAALKKLFPKKKIKVSYALPEDLDAVFIAYQKPLETRFSKIIAKNERVAPELLEEIFEDAILFKASDIHFEPQTTDVVIRFRVDGVLHHAGRVPKEHYENVLNRIKIKSRLRIDEHFSAQDGSLHYEQGGHAVDMRTSIIPTIDGEKVVLRVLAAYVQGLSLVDLGFSSEHQQMIETAGNKPFGMILIVGPTGSGKTTTLYALLKILNNPEVNITTIEDPVEYKMQGINQIQVNTQTNLTFAKGLRSIVRQDPDIILVGEIRDEETAEIGVNAALTGHLLLSTFHANDAATSIPRLLDMGIEPFLLASTLDVIVAQRLVRKICAHCRISYTKKPSDFLSTPLKAAAIFLKGKSVTLYKGKGCDACGETGYKGRTAIFEFILVTPSMQELMLKKPSTQEIWNQAVKEGSTSLFEDGIEKVKNGMTTLEELFRVVEPPAV